MNTSAENRKTKMLVKSITSAFNNLNAEVERLRDESEDTLNYIITRKDSRNFVTEFKHGLILIALYEITKKIIHKWM